MKNVTISQTSRREFVKQSILALAAVGISTTVGVHLLHIPQVAASSYQESQSGSYPAQLTGQSLFPFVLPWDDDSDSATNMSHLATKPAGMLGYVYTGSDGHTYAGEQRIRFFGVNMVDAACFPTKQEAERIAARMAKFGLNIVRLHHMDLNAFPWGIWADSGLDFDREALDRLDYLVSQLKANGIYINLNLLVGRQFSSTPGLPADIKQLSGKNQRLVGFFYEPILRLQMEYASKLLTHHNPYTDMSYADDPAVAFIEIQNENGLVRGWLEGSIDKLPQLFLNELGRQWNEWLEGQYGTTEQLTQAWQEPINNGRIEDGTVPAVLFSSFGTHTKAAQRDWLRFLWEKEDDYWQTMYLYLKDNLSVKALIIGTALYGTPNMMGKLNCVDTHGYWQHPTFQGATWDPDNWTVPDLPMVNDWSGGAFARMALRRVLGSPYSVSEYNHPAPNTYCSEGFLLLAAYGALQDWDAIYVHDYSERLGNWDMKYFPSFFEIDQHPTKMVSLIPSALLFRRGDVKPSQKEIVVTMSKDDELNSLQSGRAFGDNAYKLVDAESMGVPKRAALLHRISVATEGRSAPPSAMRPEEIASEMAAIDQSNRYASDTGELVWDMKNHGLGVVTANTARTKAVIGYAGDKRFDLGGSIVEPKQTMQNGWCAITITTIEGDLPSQLHPQAAGPLRLVITATGYVENTNMGWKNQEKSTVGRDWGTAPSLVEGISARITLPLPSEHVQAWALDERGHRKAQIPTGRSENGSAIILLDPSWHTLWYEVQLTAGLVPTLRG